ncbi:MAG: alpha/beta hydrolase [Caulobacter sp.]|nr:alpha/beta hydrolase [Caulobacter sp.]
MRRREFLISTGLAATAISVGLSAKAADPAVARADVAASRRYTAERRFVETRFGRIAYVDRGQGPTALFLHGFPLSGFQWRGAIERLSPYRRCLAPDSLGLGHTEPAPGQSLAPAAQVEMIAAFLDAMSVKTVDLVANDSGGAIAQLFVTRYPDRVRTLLLTNCDVETDSPPPALLPVIALARAGTYPDLWLAPWVADKALCRSPAGLGGLCYSNPAHPTDAAIDEYLAPLVATPARKALVNAYTLGLEINPLAGVEAKLRRCQVPTRMIWGLKDEIFSPRSPAYLAAILPNFRGVREIADGKLFFPEEHPDLVAEEARALWA